ncbi:hypothetical protein DVS77_15555 [Mycolicibacterium moriokaense]|nr:hypothetical protein DVS77_15555 [Mycolicibacterium moriokaense]
MRARTSSAIRNSALAVATWTAVIVAGGAVASPAAADPENDHSSPSSHTRKHDGGAGGAANPRSASTRHSPARTRHSNTVGKRDAPEAGASAGAGGVAFGGANPRSARTKHSDAIGKRDAPQAGASAGAGDVAFSADAPRVQEQDSSTSGSGSDRSTAGEQSSVGSSRVGPSSARSAAAGVRRHASTPTPTPGGRETAVQTTDAVEPAARVVARAQPTLRAAVIERRHPETATERVDPTPPPVTFAITAAPVEPSPGAAAPTLASTTRVGVVGMVARAVGGALDLLGTAPAGSGAPVGNPVFELLFAAARELQTTFLNRSPTAAPVSTGQTAAGVVTGTVGGADADGDPLTYRVVDDPAYGSVVVGADGGFVYTPTAALAASGGHDTFVVAVEEANAGQHVHGVAGLVAGVVNALTLGAIDLPDGSTTRAVVTVTVDPVPITEVATIPVGDAPVAIAVDRGTLAYVTNAGSGTVTIIDTMTYQPILQPVAVGDSPFGVAASVDGNYVYVGHGLAGPATVTVFDVDFANTPVIATPQVGDAPIAVTYSPDRSGIYVANYLSDSVSVIDPVTNTVVNAPIPVGAMPSALASSPDGTRVYVANNGDGTVSVIDTNTNTVTGSPIDVGGDPVALAVSPDGTHVYVAHATGDTVSVIDTDTGAVRSIQVGLSPAGIAFSLDGSLAYVTNSGENTVSLIDTATENVVGAPIAVGEHPVGVAVAPDGTVFVVNQDSNTVSVLTASTSVGA